MNNHETDLGDGKEEVDDSGEVVSQEEVGEGGNGDVEEPEGLVYPSGLDEERMGEMVQELLDGIDRDRLYQDERLTRVRHPLLTERMGREVALNCEIYNLIDGLTGAILERDNSVRARSHAERMQAQDILVDNASDRNDFIPNLQAFMEAVVKCAELNLEPTPDDMRVRGVVQGLLKSRLVEMPNVVHDYILYPPVTLVSLGEPIEQALQGLEDVEAEWLEALGKKDDEGSMVMKKAVEAEVAAVKAWFEKEQERIVVLQQQNWKDLKGLADWEGAFVEMFDGRVAREVAIFEKDGKKSPHADYVETLHAALEMHNWVELERYEGMPSSSLFQAWVKNYLGEARQLLCKTLGEYIAMNCQDALGFESALNAGSEHLSTMEGWLQDWKEEMEEEGEGLSQAGEGAVLIETVEPVEAVLEETMQGCCDRVMEVEDRRKQFWTESKKGRRLAAVRTLALAVFSLLGNVAKGGVRVNATQQLRALQGEDLTDYDGWGLEALRPEEREEVVRLICERVGFSDIL